MKRQSLLHLALLALFLSSAALAAAGAQQHVEPAQQPQPAQPAQHASPNASPDASPTQELVEASQDAQHAGAPEHGEKEEEDEEAQFKFSASVRWLAEHTGMSTETAYWVAISLNFLVVFGFIAWAIKRSAPIHFRERTASIKKQLEEARAASEEANRRLAEVEGRLARLDSEIAEMRAQAERDAAAEEQRLRAQAEQDRQKIVTQAEQEIASAAKLARGELKQYVAELAVTLAEKKMEVTPQTDQGLIRSFVENLGTEAKS